MNGVRKMSRIRHLYPEEFAKIVQAQQPSLTPHILALSSEASVTIVVLTLDRLHLTRRCIESIYANSDYPFELLIHDNGSQPEMLAYLRHVQTAHDNVQLIHQPAHIGIAAARNLTFAHVKTDYIFSLDNDVVCHPGWLRETMACAARHSAAFVAPLRLDMHGHVWAFAPELIRTENGTVLEIARWFHDLTLERVQSLFSAADVSTNFISGGAGLFARDPFQACGGFDERYYFGFEDMDFSLKLAERGYKVWATPCAVLTHDDEWLPQTDADVQYARARYDAPSLQLAAERFQSRWGINVLPTKYVESFQQRLERKIEAKS